jgi:hypothetical protein
MIGIAPNDEIAAYAVAWDDRLEEVSVELRGRNIDIHVAVFVPDAKKPVLAGRRRRERTVWIGWGVGRGSGAARA